MWQSATATAGGYDWLLLFKELDWKKTARPSLAGKDHATEEF